MARGTDSFFIRANVEVTNGAFSQTELDLGAYVDALGKSVLKIHNVQLAFQDATALYRPPTYNAGTGADLAWQLSTQTQAAILRPSDRSIVSAGSIQCGDVTAGNITTEAAGVNVQHFTDGYLIAVESLYLGGQQTGMSNNTSVSIVLECTVESLTQSAAMALALSQQ